MDQALHPISCDNISFTGANGNVLCGSVWQGLGSETRTVLLLHGGGQTRHSWQGTAEMLARRGWRSISVDQRGHGESDWVEDGDYSFQAYARDVCSIARQIKQNHGQLPVLIGASLGGLAGLRAAALDDGCLSALVLVDITPFVKADGVERILGFMAENAEAGFATLEAASDAIAAYLPHRPKPASLSGLAKNLRQDADGRYRWHWDPRFLDSRRSPDEHASEARQQLGELARQLSIPTLLVRGRESELVGEDEARRFLELVPHARMTDVSGARHMVAGDRNDVFTDAVVEFLSAL
ncbi:MAG: alpha/beta hydrolase [Rhizobiales bacterium]|nr:alpha/beta hydrolase [Hyphomicrobiales bacterium]